LLIFAGRDIAYIDALFFATGACTQAGLNVIDINLLNTWQQVTPLSDRYLHYSSVFSSWHVFATLLLSTRRWWLSDYSGLHGDSSISVIFALLNFLMM
jgi:hypothetical protein